MLLRYNLTLALVVGSALAVSAAERAQVVPLAQVQRAQKPRIVADPTRDMIFPYIYDGAGWSTMFVFTNLDNHTAKLNLEFSADDGSDQPLPLVGAGTSNAFTITIPVGGTVSLTTADSSHFTPAYAFVTSANGTDRFSGYAVVLNITPNLPDLEFTIPLTPINENVFVLPFDSTNGFTSRAALINSSLHDDALVTLTVLDQDGNVLTTDQVTVGPFGRFRFVVTDRYPQLKGIVGSIMFSAPGNQFVAGLGLRLGPNGSWTAIPPFSL